VDLLQNFHGKFQPCISGYDACFSQHGEEICGTKNAEIFQPPLSSYIGEIVHDFSAG
jgi:hypothetical protein